MNERLKNKNEKHKKPRGIAQLLVKCLLWTLAGIVALLCLLLAFTQTPIFRDRLLGFAVGRANEMLEGRLAIESLDGNLFTRFQLYGILLESSGDTVLAVTRLEAAYSPSKLLDGIIAIDSLLIEAPYVKLHQSADSSWNVSRLLKQKAEKESAGGIDEPFGWTVSVGALELDDGDIRISAIDTIIPARITGLDIGLMGSWSSERWELDLQKFTLRSSEPSLYIETLTFQSEGDNNRLSLQDLVLRTARNNISANATWFFNRSGRSNASLETGPLDVSEFKGLMELPFSALHPSLTAEAVYHNDRLDLDCTVRADTQRIDLDAGISGFSNVTGSASGEPAQFEADINIRNLDPAQWLGDSAFAGMLNGDLRLKGSGADTGDIELDAVASFKDCRMFQRRLQEANIEAGYSAGDAECRIDMRSEFGRGMIEATMEGVSAERAYTLAATLREIDIAVLTGNDSLSSDINGDLEAKGKGFDPRTMNTELYLTLSPTVLPGFEIDTMTASARIEQGRCIIDTLHLGSLPAELVASGLISLTSHEADLEYSLRVGELMGLAPFVGADTLHVSGYLTGIVSGTTDSLRAEAELQLRNIVYNEFSVDSLSGTAFFTSNGEIPGGGCTLTAYKARMPKAAVDAIGIRTEYAHPKTDVAFDIRHGKDFTAALEAAFIADSIPEITIEKIAVDSKGTIWKGGSEDMRILIKGDSYHIHNFEIGMEPDSTARRQLVRAEGILSMSGDENLRFEIAGLDLGVISGIFEIPVGLDGLFDLEATLKGTAQQPLVQGSASIAGGRVNRFNYKELGGTFGYSDSRLALDFNLIPTEGNSLNITGSVPADIALSGQADFLLPRGELDVNIKTGGLPLSLLTAGRFDLGEIEGQLECDINIHNTLATPLFDGYLRVRDGRIGVQRLGIVLDDIQLEASLDSTRLLLDRLHALSDPGRLDASGYIDFDSTIASGVITGALFDLAVREFYLVKNRTAELEISGDVKLKSEGGFPVFSGSMEIPRSSFYFPSFLRGALWSPGGGNSVPMLVEATRAGVTGLDSLGAGLKEELAEIEEEAPPFFERVKGELTVTIPRNTWIKSPEMRLELSGDFYIVKKGDIFEPFGTIKIERGHFNLFGKYFQVKTGRISFEGGKKINPEILLEAEYEFRTSSREKKALQVSITGKPDNPIIKFTVDNRELNEGEAIMLILFGQMPDQLLYGEKSGSGGDGGTSIGSSLLSYQLSKTLGETFDVDYIEVKSEDNWSSASVYVGKYVTNDLFLSYQRGFGDNQYDNTNVEEITMEYELRKYLFLQLIQGDTNTSGYDLIFKIDR